MSQKKKQDSPAMPLEQGVHGCSEAERYIWPEDPAVLEKLQRFRGYKLGFMMHWAPGSLMGTFESWGLSDDDRRWSQRDIDWTDDIERFKKAYWESYKHFAPHKFDPTAWAKLAKECGFRYLLFTTKHHDGFCMWDTDTTAFKITNPDCPHHAHPHADIVKALYEAFRAEGLAISTYFSKPDWHSPYYWKPEVYPSPNRNVNYDVTLEPERWAKFVDYTHRQIKELLSRYGEIDCLWLDGGWVRPSIQGQDIRLGELVEELRQNLQPGLIVADRTVGGPYENILTPEQAVPAHAIPVPWESCISLGRYFSFHYNDQLKTTEELVKLFIGILSKGGSLALNVTPQPDGDISLAAKHVLRQFGLWVQQHADAIYDSEISPVKTTRDFSYTRRDGKDYAFYLYAQFGPHPYLKPHLELDCEREVSQVRLLRNNQVLPFKQLDQQHILVETRSVSIMGAEYAECFEISYD